MKKIGVVLLGVGLLFGCDVATADENNIDYDDRFKGVKGEISIITDSETGCKYIYADRGFSNTQDMALSPLMKSDGTVDCDN